MTPEQIRKRFGPALGPALDKAGNKLSRAYFMMSKTMEYTEEAADILEDAGLKLPFVGHYVKNMDYNLRLMMTEFKQVMDDKDREHLSYDWSTVGVAIDQLMDGRLSWNPVSFLPSASCNVYVWKDGVSVPAFYNHLTKQFSVIGTHWMLGPLPPVTME